MRNYNQKIIVILGPTSSGKSDVAIRLAKKFGGEIISADSRQIYRGMDIGTGKITKVEQKIVKHYGIDIVNPKTEYNATKFKKYTDKIITDIFKRGKLPIICGGTGFWIKAIVDNIVYPEVKPNWKLRNKLRNYSAEKLFKILKKLDSIRAKNIDAKNPVRLIRAIEICKTLGKVPNIYELRNKRKYETLQIGIELSKEKLHQRIKLRLQQRFKEGMIEEVEKLHFQNKISWKRLESFGLGYKLIPQYLKKEIKTQEELFEKIYQSEKDYAKRQMTWFAKDKKIIWLPACRRGREKYRDIEKEVKKFLK